MTTHPPTGITTVSSRHSVDQTVQNLRQLIESKGLVLFAFVDHSGEAEKAGLHMPPTKLIIFGNPKGGTPLMLASPSMAIDLPLKILIAEDAGGAVWISYNTPEFLQARHNLPPELTKNLAAVEGIAKAIG